MHAPIYALTFAITFALILSALDSTFDITFDIPDYWYHFRIILVPDKCHFGATSMQKLCKICAKFRATFVWFTLYPLPTPLLAEKHDYRTYLCTNLCLQITLFSIPLLVSLLIGIEE